jgi:hypothetical protein
MESIAEQRPVRILRSDDGGLTPSAFIPGTRATHGNANRTRANHIRINRTWSRPATPRKMC